MSQSRLVEYFLVAGVDPSSTGDSATGSNAEGAAGVTSPVSPLSPLSEHTSRGKLC